jgi:hypothetical protein
VCYSTGMRKANVRLWSRKLRAMGLAGDPCANNEWLRAGTARPCGRCSDCSAPMVPFAREIRARSRHALPEWESVPWVTARGLELRSLDPANGCVVWICAGCARARAGLPSHLHERLSLLVNYSKIQKAQLRRLGGPLTAEQWAALGKAPPRPRKPRARR